MIRYILAKPLEKEADQRNQFYENINQLSWKAFEFKSN
jgi:hypothetical protein